MRKIVTLAAAAVLLNACNGGSPAPSQPPEPHITLSVPETVVSRGKAQLVLDSTGYDGQTAQLYIFREDFGETSTCSDTTVRPIPIQLRGGPQRITIDTGQPGDLWIMLTGEDFETKCGETKTRALINTLAEIAPGCTGEGSSYNCPATWPAYKAGDEVSYRVSSAVPPEGSVELRISWVGPFASAPEAKASPCAVEPVALSDEVALAYDPSSTGATSAGDPSSSQVVKRVVPTSGVYRMLLSVDESEYVAAYVPDCSTAPLLTVK